MFARESGKRSWEQLEEEELGGMKLQGPSTAVEAFGVIKKRKSVRRFPLLTTIYRIAHEGQDAKTIVEFDKGGASSGPTGGGRRRTDTSTDFLSSRL